MVDKKPSAMRITPENLRVALKQVPQLNDAFVGDVLDAYLVLHVPRFNKDGSLSRRPPLRWKLFNREAFFASFKFVEKQKKREFTLVEIVTD